MNKDELVEIYLDRFVNRTDIWFKQWLDVKGNRACYSCQEPGMDTKNGRFPYEPVTPYLVERIFAGQLSAGWPALASGSTSKWLCFDSDQEDGELMKLDALLKEHGWKTIREGQRPGREGHLWLLLDEPVETMNLIVLGDAMMKFAKTSKLERFPKSAEGLSQVRAPLSINLKPEAQGARGWFDGPDQVLTSQLEWLAAQPRNRAIDANRLSEQHRPASRTVVKAPPSKRPFLRSHGEFNILDYVNARRSGNRLVAACPVCEEEGHDRHRDNLSISTDGKKYCCWYGGQPGKIHTSSAIRQRLMSRSKRTIAK